MNDDDRFAKLWADYLEGELDPAGELELHAMLSRKPVLLEQAVDLFQLHRMLGLAASADPARRETFVRDTLARLPATQDAFVAGVMAHVTHPHSRVSSPSVDLLRTPDAVSAKARPRTSRWTAARVAIGLFALCGMIGLSVWLPSVGRAPVVARHAMENRLVPEPTETALLASQSHARFFGELAPPVGAPLIRLRDYVLMGGLVELVFPTGASAIIEGPAVFRVVSGESLALDLGRCSVHAPDGAEGFRVETPLTRVVDRGTRFSVNVSELSETEVQVIEGAADVYRQANDSQTGAAGPHPVKPDARLATRLTDGEAQKFSQAGQFSVDTIPFNPQSYVRQLPDRVVSYRATPGTGGVENLLSVTVQRLGDVAEIPAEQLIPAEVIWFKGAAGAYLCGGASLPTPRREVFADRSLVTGVINPGGSQTPLTTSPVMTPENGTPGMAIRFRQPVTNGPGADVVFFDLQNFANPPEGDAFHVSPLVFRDGLRSRTIREYDLTMESPAALDLADFEVYMFEHPVDHLAELETVGCVPRRQVVRFRGLAVGIDLSDLGYAEGDEVDGLFIQDALDDRHYVDPVFVAGLPVRSTGTRTVQRIRKN